MEDAGGRWGAKQLEGAGRRPTPRRRRRSRRKESAELGRGARRT
jgi:hypothetical protein